ncbi:hypothetical protein FHP25_35885 [Vineibacter terrae]|uniref:DUF3168 domain-containing protein n=1 Tax=Vineibacter terrae TaxID=2586908 RepID=A0A5C8PAP4_9HYPH|nr:hypothetical protein [Vineibacter terrae]TXL70105.1 hypothetical protein FHP25_35885 [Vineibacter terrae]
MAVKHHRQALREAAAAILADLPSTRERVYQSRVWPVDASRLPCLLIFTRREQRGEVSRPPRKFDRSLELIVEGIVAASEATLDDRLDTIAAEVEAALAASPNLAGTAKECIYENTVCELRAREGEKPVGAVQLVYAVEYRTTEADPTVGIA